MFKHKKLFYTDWWDGPMELTDFDSTLIIWYDYATYKHGELWFYIKSSLVPIYLKGKLGILDLIRKSRCFLVESDDLVHFKRVKDLSSSKSLKSIDLLPENIKRGPISKYQVLSTKFIPSI